MSVTEEVLVVEQPTVPTPALNITLSTSFVRKDPNQNETILPNMNIKPRPPSHPRPERAGSAGSKREAQGPIVTTSDEEETLSPPSSPRSHRGTSPSKSCSSYGTSSDESLDFGHNNNAYRFQNIANFSVQKPKVKKKKTQPILIHIHSTPTKMISKESVLPPSRPKRGKNPFFVA